MELRTECSGYNATFGENVVGVVGGRKFGISGFGGEFAIFNLANANCEFRVSTEAALTDLSFASGNNVVAVSAADGSIR